MTKQLITYAQNREDLLLNAFFDPSERGFYVDVGANHPVHESVTKLFYDKGWHGMNLEPTAWLYELLCLARPRDINVQVGVSDTAGSLTFREYPHGNGLSTFATNVQKEYERKDSFFTYFTSEFKEYKVPVKTLRELFKEHNVNQIDFMKVDIEGYEYEALAGNDWKRYRPKVLCVEANHIMRDWHPLVMAAGYELAFFDGLNEYFVATEERERAQRFSYPDQVLFGPRYLSWHDYKVEQDLQRDIKVLEYELRIAKQTTQPQATTGQALSAKQQVRRKLSQVDAVIEHGLTRRSHTSNQPMPDIKSTKELSEALINQLHVSQNQGEASTRSATLKTYRSLKQRAKRTIRRARG